MLTDSDVDECTLGDDDCDENAGCINNVGSFTCMCNTGYSDSGSGRRGHCSMFIYFNNCTYNLEFILLNNIISSRYTSPIILLSLSSFVNGRWKH